MIRRLVQTSPARSTPALVIIATLILITLSSPLRAAKSDNTVDLSTPPSDHVIVRASCYVIDVLDVSGPSKSYNADLVLQYEWEDPRLAALKKADSEIPIDQLWQPELIIANIGTAEENWASELELIETGTVRIVQRWNGDFTAQFDLKEFPRDTQQLGVQILTPKSMGATVEIIPDDEKSGQAETFSVTNWKIGTLEALDAPYLVRTEQTPIPGVRFQMSANRFVSYYMGTIIATTTIIMCMAWLVFWIDPSSVNPRVSISVTSMLTLIAHRFVIQSELPNLPYLTSMDIFLLGCTCLLLFGLGMVVYIINLLANQQDAHARRINNALRFTYPIPFIALLLLAL